MEGRTGIVEGEAASVSAGAEDYTLGVEEEYRIIGPETRALSPSGQAVVRRAQQALGEEHIAPEFRTSQVVAMTPICRTLAEVRAELLRLRRGVIGAAAGEGCQVAAASTHPFSHWEEQPVTPKGRYREIVEREQQLAEEQVVFGFQVHIGLEDRETAVEVINRARVWLAPILVLSAGSPFWLGRDTGYASCRTQVWSRLPSAGPPAPFTSLAEHDALVKALAETGSALDVASVYWDRRLPERLETVEIRVADVCGRIDEAVMLAGLARALVRTCRERAERGEPYPRARPELLRAAHWGASRHGLDAGLVDVEARRTAPAPEIIERLLAFVRPALEEHGDYEEASTLAYDTPEQGNGARRQRKAYERAGRLEDVVDMLMEETAQWSNSA